MSRKEREPGHFFNRELSWLEFNDRVLHELLDADKPLLERLKFAAIVSSNLDEFFMVRVAGLKRLLTSATVRRTADGMTAGEQLLAIAQRCRTMVADQYRCLTEEVLPGLERGGVALRRMAELDPAGQDWCDEYFHRRIFPVLTPLAIDPGHPFPHLRNRSLNLAVSLAPRRLLNTIPRLALVRIPETLPRIVSLPDNGNGHEYTLLEDIVAHQVQELFQGLEVTACAAVRVTRDSDLTFDEEDVEDLLESIEQELRNREWNDVVRLEVDANCHEDVVEELRQALGIQQHEIYSIAGPLDLTCLWELYGDRDHAELRDRPFAPTVVPCLRGKEDLFAAIREQDVLLHHPYDSFGSVVEFVEQAAGDPDVLAIKQTLYRTSGDSPLVRALAEASQNGKQVTALVELKARFDEEANIRWTRELEEAGVHVVYGLIGLKTHCKLLLVVRREEDRLRRYVHLGTGNYHPATAKLYTDVGLLTCELPYGQDVSRLFNILTGYSEFPEWRRLIVAPQQLRQRCVELIEREVEHTLAGRGGLVVAKMNSLVDPETIEALYRASQAGVTIRLIIRGICCLRPGLPGLSESITVRSIVGRFLEHSRVFYFHNGGSPEVYASSADWMQRNFGRRVEQMFPVEKPELRRRLVIETLAAGFADNQQAWELNSDGTYTRVRPGPGEDPLDSQEWLLSRAQMRSAELPEPVAKQLLQIPLDDAESIPTAAGSS